MSTNNASFSTVLNNLSSQVDQEKFRYALVIIRDFNVRLNYLIHTDNALTQLVEEPTRMSDINIHGNILNVYLTCDPDKYTIIVNLTNFLSHPQWLTQAIPTNHTVSLQV